LNRHIKMKKRCFCFHLVAAVILFMLCLSMETSLAGEPDALASQPDRLVRKVAASRADDPFDGILFRTIYKSGFDVCTNTDGQPVIFLFSSTTCSHCDWLGEIFDVIAMNYMEDGLIEAHHYDTPTGDDLFTDEIETEIPEEMLELYHRGNPTNRVPYLNFSCKYERIGTEYEKDQDAEAEGREIIEVIESLIRVLSTPDNTNRVVQ